MSNSESVDKNLIRSFQVSSLPIGPGGSNPTKRQLNDINTQLSMLTAQAMADTKYDPQVPEPITKQVIKEGFVSNNGLSSVIMVTGVLFIVYGFIAK